MAEKLFFCSVLDLVSFFDLSIWFIIYDPMNQMHEFWCSARYKTVVGFWWQVFVRWEGENAKFGVFFFPVKNTEQG